MKLWTDRRFFNCACATEGIILDCDDEDKQFYLAIWEYGEKGSQLGWWDRLRHAWKTLTCGFPYEDQTILDPDEAERFANTILEKVAEWKKDDKRKAP